MTPSTAPTIIATSPSVLGTTSFSTPITPLLSPAQQSAKSIKRDVSNYPTNPSGMLSTERLTNKKVSMTAIVLTLIPIY
jgi:hypothetical protein